MTTLEAKELKLVLDLAIEIKSYIINSKFEIYTLPILKSNTEINKKHKALIEFMFNNPTIYPMQQLDFLIELFDSYENNGKVTYQELLNDINHIINIGLNKLIELN